MNENDIIKLANKKYEIIKKNINIKYSEQEKELNKKYNISNINKKVGPIFNINLNSCQYIDINSLDSIRNQNQNDSNSQNNLTSKKNEEEIKCRKCEKIEIDDETYENLNNNPLLKICLCHDYIHYKCLKDIMDKNISKHINLNENVIRYKIKNFYCDKCNMQYPLRFKIKEISEEYIYELIDLTLPPKETDFLV